MKFKSLVLAVLMLAIGSVAFAKAPAAGKKHAHGKVHVLKHQAGKQGSAKHQTVRHQTAKHHKGKHKKTAAM